MGGFKVYTRTHHFYIAFAISPCEPTVSFGITKREGVVRMSKLTDDEKEALRIAAAAAEPVLVRLRRLREELDEKIAKFEVIVTSYMDIAGKRRKPSGDSVDGDE